MPPMMIACPGCQTRLKVTEEMLGKSIQCPSCKKSLKLGARPSASPAEKPPAQRPAPAPQKPPEEEVLDESQLETVEEEEILDEGRLETVEDDLPAPRSASRKRRQREEEDDAGDDAGVELNTEEFGDPLENLKLNKAQMKEVRQELTKGERIIWAGTTSDRVQAANARSARFVGFIFLPIGIVFGVVAVVLYLSGVFPFWGMIGLGAFALIWSGIAILAIMAPVMYLSAQRRRARGERPHLSDLFILTNRRCICWVARFSGRVFSYNKLQVSEMQRKDSSYIKGAGDLVFDTIEEVHTTGGSRHASAHIEEIPVGFIGIDDVRAVERLVRSTLLGGKY